MGDDYSSVAWLCTRPLTGPARLGEPGLLARLPNHGFHDFCVALDGQHDGLFFHAVETVSIEKDALRGQVKRYVRSLLSDHYHGQSCTVTNREFVHYVRIGPCEISDYEFALALAL